MPKRLQWFRRLRGVEHQADGAFTAQCFIEGAILKLMARNLLLGVAVGFVALSGAQAADLPPRPAPYRPPIFMPPLFTWTGFYVGGNVGGGWFNGEVDSNFGSTWSTSNGAFLGGGQLGSTTRWAHSSSGWKVILTGPAVRNR